MGYEPAKVDNRSTKDLVMSLKQEFQTSKFEFVASILASREEKLKREIAAKAEEIQGLWLEKEQARLEKMQLEEELKTCKIEVEKTREFEDRVNRLGEEMEKLLARQLAGSEDVGRGGVQAPPENRGGGSVHLTAEGNGIASASGMKKGDGNKQLNLEMNVKKEKEDLVSEGIGVYKRVELGIELNVKENGGGGKIGLNRSVDLKSNQAVTSSGNHGNTRPTPAAGTIIEISDSDDESTRSKAPKEGTSKQPHAGAGHSGKVAVEDGTGVLKRKFSSSPTNDYSGQHPEKLTKHHNVIHIGRTVAALVKQGSPKLALPAVADVSSSSSSSDDEFDPSTEITYKPSL